MSAVSALMVAGVSSGVGKTSISVGLMAALRSSGYSVSGAKVGPDYIDPSYHRIATGKPSYNLDLFMTGRLGIAESFRRAAAGAHLCVVEGVMGLFDGSDHPGIDATISAASDAQIPAHRGLHSSYEVAIELGLPILLVMDARASSQSLAAVAAGFRSISEEGSICGVVLNRVRSDRHEQLASEALTSLGIPIFGVLRDGALPSFESRHLGLIPSEARLADAKNDIALIESAVRTALDLEALLGQFRPIELSKSRAQTPSRTPSVAIAVAQGPAFSFTYQENLDILTESGAEVIGFDPASDKFPEGATAVILGGGFPELYLEQINDNLANLKPIATLHHGGMPIWAECGGLMLLGERIDRSYGLGVLPLATSMTKKLSLGYQRATAQSESLLFPAHATVFGHEFHYSLPSDQGNLLISDFEPSRVHGFGSATLYASYLHLHLGSQLDISARFLAAARKFAASRAKN